MRKLIRICIPKIAYFSGLVGLFRFLNRGRMRILSFHNILPECYLKEVLPCDGMTLSASVFRQQIGVIKDSYSVGVDMGSSELILTFDDGYINQIEIGMSILWESGLNGYVFYPLSLLDEDRVLDIDRALAWVSFAPAGQYEIIVSDEHVLLNLKSTQDRFDSWAKINRWYLEKERSVAEFRDLVKQLERCVPWNRVKLAIDKEYYRLRFVGSSVEQLELVKSRGGYIGAHSMWHYPLSKMHEDELAVDFEKCRTATCGGFYNTNVFCYPFGGVGEVDDRSMKFAENCKFEYGLSNNISCETKYSQYFVPRMGLGDMTSKYDILFVLSGASYFLEHHKLLPRV